MPARWQQWMPLYLDRLRASLSFQAMEDSAKIGFLFLLMAQWESDDCTLSFDPHELAVKSGLGDKKWARFGAAILRKFKTVTVTVDGSETERIRNSVCYQFWLEAKRIHDARKTAAAETNAARSKRRSPPRSQVHNNNPLQEQGQEQEQGESAQARTAAPSSPRVAETLQPDWDADEEENIPDDIPSVVLGNFILARLSIPHSFRLASAFADTVDLLARDEKRERGQAARLLIQRARDAPPGTKWAFWLQDGGWKQRGKEGVSTEGWE